MHEVTGRYLPATGPTKIEEDNSTIVPLIDGEDYFGSIRMEIGRAQSPGDAIYMLGWRFQSDFRFSKEAQDLTEFGKVLAVKAAAGVDVRIIMPAKWQLLYMLQSSTEKELRDKGNTDLNNQLDRFGPSGNPRQATLLREQDVGGNKPLRGRVLLDHSSELFGIHHQKMVIVLRGGVGVGFVAGLDFLADRLDSSRHDEALPRKNPSSPADTISYYWHDIGARIEGPAVSGLLYYFISRWAYFLQLSNRSFKLKDGQDIPSLNPQVEGSAPRSRIQNPPVLNTSPAAARLKGVYIAANFPEQDVRGNNPVLHEPHGIFPKPGVHTTGILYKKAIGSARKYIYIEDQYFAAQSLEEALREAARKEVKIIAVMGGYDDDLGKAVVPQINSPFLKSLGDKVAVMHVKETIVHSKLMIIDDEFVAIGSTNFADRSLIEAKDLGGGTDAGLRDLLKEMNQAWGTDSELTVAAVDDRRTDWNVAFRLRVRLWAEHLRVDVNDTRIWKELADLGMGLSIFKDGWGKPVTFNRQNSRLIKVEIL